MNGMRKLRDKLISHPISTQEDGADQAIMTCRIIIREFLTVGFKIR